MKNKNSRFRCFSLFYFLALFFISTGDLKGDDKFRGSSDTHSRAIYADKKTDEPSDYDWQRDRRSAFQELERRIKQNIFDSYQGLWDTEDDDLDGIGP